SATHRKAGYSTESLFTFNTISLFNKRHELFKEKVFITPFVFQVIEVSTCSGVGIRHYDNHRRGATCQYFPVSDGLHFAKLDPTCLVISTSMQQIQYRVFSL